MEGRCRWELREFPSEVPQNCFCSTLAAFGALIYISAENKDLISAQCRPVKLEDRLDRRRLLVPIDGLECLDDCGDGVAPGHREINIRSCSVRIGIRRRERDTGRGELLDDEFGELLGYFIHERYPTDCLQNSRNLDGFIEHCRQDVFLAGLGDGSGLSGLPLVVRL